MITARGLMACGAKLPVDQDVLISTQSYSEILPTGLGWANRKQINYGAVAQGDSTTDVMIDADGNVAFNKAGTYTISFYYRYGRAASSQTARLVLWSTFNGFGAGDPLPVELASQYDRSVIEATIPITVPAGLVLGGYIMRDTEAQTANDGGLYPYVVTDTSGGAQGPTNGASASLIIYRYKS